MSRSQEALLRPQSFDLSDERGRTEEQALLTSRHQPSTRTRGWSWREILTLIYALSATVAVIALAVVVNKSQGDTLKPGGNSPSGKKNLIFMVSDGMGPTSLSLTRSFRQVAHGLPYDEALVLDGYMIGSSRTRSSSSLITDSAAGATAFSCGKKSYNGAISTLPDYSPCGTVLEAAHKAGYKTGLVVTTRITDATPACFASHVKRRDEEDRIAEQLLGDYPLGRTVDLILGAGRCHFLPNTTIGSCRKDSKNLIEMAKDQGFEYVGNRKEFDALQLGDDVKLPLLGLLANEDIPYDIDRVHEEDVYPSLQEMTKLALRALRAATSGNDKGFFLMVEGSRIDHAGHANDPAAQVHEVLAYDRAFQSVLEFLEEDKTAGILIATSDHETGGLATARQSDPYVYPEYAWYPKVLVNVSRSSEWLQNEYLRHIHSSDDIAHRDATAFLRSAIPEHLGIQDVSEDEIGTLLEKPEFGLWLFADMISRRSETGWSSHGHSAADVNIYSSSKNLAGVLTGNHENTDIGVFLREYLEVDVDAVTEELKRKGPFWDGKIEGDGWMGRAPLAGERTDGGSHMDRSTNSGTHQRCYICNS